MWLLQGFFGGGDETHGRIYDSNSHSRMKSGGSVLLQRFDPNTLHRTPEVARNLRPFEAPQKQKGNTMSLTELTHLLLISTLINYAIVAIWFLVFVYAHEALYRLHTRWFRLSPQDFDKIHYAAIAIYKIGVLLLNLAPLIAISIVGN
jgi:hypothetical protein